MQRILILGNNGSGKSTFARNLEKKLDLEVIHLEVISKPCLTKFKRKSRLD